MGRTHTLSPTPWLPPFAEEEYDAVSQSICLRIQDGTMPPDDAYWWTRVLVADAVCALMQRQGAEPQVESSRSEPIQSAARPAA